MTKQCRKCLKSKPLDEFSKLQKDRAWLHSNCRKCESARATQRNRIRRAAIAANDELEIRGKARTERINLGLAISATHAKPGVARTREEIACFAGCSPELIRQIELGALRKLGNELRRRGMAKEFKAMMGEAFSGRDAVMEKPRRE